MLYIAWFAGLNEQDPYAFALPTPQTPSSQSPTASGFGQNKDSIFKQPHPRPMMQSPYDPYGQLSGGRPGEIYPPHHQPVMGCPDAYSLPPGTPRPSSSDSSPNQFIRHPGSSRPSPGAAQQGHTPPAGHRPSPTQEGMYGMPRMPGPYHSPRMAEPFGLGDHGAHDRFANQQGQQPPQQITDSPLQSPKMQRINPTMYQRSISDPYGQPPMTPRPNTTPDPYGHPPMTPRPAGSTDPYNQSPMTPRPASTEQFGLQMPPKSAPGLGESYGHMTPRPQIDPYSQQPMTPRSQNTMDPYSQQQAIGTRMPNPSDPYNQMPMTPRPSNEPYAQPPSTPKPDVYNPSSKSNVMDPYSHPVMTPRPNMPPSDPYGKPPMTPRAAAPPDPYGHPPMTPRPGDMYGQQRPAASELYGGPQQQQAMMMRPSGPDIYGGQHMPQQRPEQYPGQAPGTPQSITSDIYAGRAISSDMFRNPPPQLSRSMSAEPYRGQLRPTMPGDPSSLDMQPMMKQMRPNFPMDDGCHPSAVSCLIRILII